LNKYANLLLDELSGKMAKDQTLEIAKYHRVQASPGFHDAAVYVQEQLKKIGIENPVIEQFPADGKTKYWSYPAIISWWADHAEIRMVEPEELLLGRYEELPMCLATHSQAADVTAEVVDVGDGSGDEDYEGRDVKGKIALVSGGARTAHLKAVEKGSLGTIHHPPWNRAAEYPDLVQYNGIWPDQATRDKVTFGFSISDRQYQRIKRHLDDGKTVKVSCKTDARLYDGYMDVLTAQFTGTEKADEEIVLIGHLCHPKTCTNDNASGSGVLVEIARGIKALVDSGKVAPPKRTIRFMWVPEMNGTWAWMHGHQDKLRNILVSINLDMVGEHPVTVGGPLNLTVAPDSTPSYLNPLLAELFGEVADEPRGISLEGWPYGLNYRVLAYSGGSDHVCFADGAFGIPSVMIGNTDQFHHTSFDDASRVDSTKLKRVGVVTGAAALMISNADDKTALELAALTTAYGLGKIAETGTRLTRKLLSLDPAEEGFAAKLGAAYVRGVRMLDEAAEEEVKSLRTVERLSKRISVDLRDMERQLRDLSQAEKDRLRRLYERVAKQAKAKTMQKEQDKAVLETQRLVPKRAEAGPIRSLGQTEVTSEEDRKLLSQLGGTTLELLNFVDGKRSVYDIALAVSLEYRDVEPADVKRFFDLYKAAGRITYA